MVYEPNYQIKFELSIRRLLNISIFFIKDNKI